MEKQAIARLWITLVTFLIADFAAADTQRFNSGEQKVSLVELYTSEGCSSCPPADRWMTKLKTNEGLWQSFVPIAFHVDYWNQLGWRDRFSSSNYSERQRNYRKNGGISAVYTPGFVVDGEEWRGWFRKKSLPLAEIKAGILELELEEQRLSASYLPHEQSNQSHTLYVALLAMNQSTSVKRGENHGRKLTHDFVVLNLQEFEESAPLHWNAELNWKALVKTWENQGQQALNPSFAIAAWVSEKGKTAPKQALGGSLKLNLFWLSKPSIKS